MKVNSRSFRSFPANVTSLFTASCVAAAMLAGQPMQAQSGATPPAGAAIGAGGGDSGGQQDPGAAGGGGGGAQGARRGGGRGGAGGGRGGGGVRGMYKDRVSPNWFHDNTRFWYVNNLKDGAKEFILVDAEKGTREPAFDHAKLASALSKAMDQNYTADKLPFSEIQFVDNDGAVQFKVMEKSWKCSLSSYQCTEVKEGAMLNIPANTELADAKELPTDDAAVIDNGFAERNEFAMNDDADEDALSPLPPGARGGRAGGGAGGGGGRGGGRGGDFAGPREVDSPDGKWTAVLKDFNVYLRAKEGGAETQISEDGVTNNAYQRIAWAGDSQGFVAWRVEPGNTADVYRLQSSPATPGGRAVLQSQNYPQAGDTFTRYELSLFTVAGRKQIKPQVERTDFRTPNLRWNKDGFHFSYQKEDRGHQRFRIIEVDTHTGAVRNIVDEKTDTFIWTDNRDAVRNLQKVTFLQNTEEAIFESETSGWRHLYLVDMKAGGKSGLTPITRGEWLVRGVDRIDEEGRQIWFQANGLRPDENPYNTHFCRINFDGTGMVVMTEGNGEHSVAYSPDRKYMIDTYSRLDTPNVNTLRRVSDGKLVCKLEETDMTEAKANGWVPPLEPFVAKGRDGKTDIYGYIERPRNFDPTKKYPIVEDIYAGPQGTPATLVPQTFAGAGRHATYTAAGFIVVKIEGMGMPNRSKAFQDVAWHNLADAGFPDRIAWMKAAAEKYPYMDATRVGIFGTSAGGQNAAGAVLFHPEFYKVAVANCGCHDNRVDKSSWNEQWMGYCPPDKIWSKDPDNWYAQNSNVDNAYRLKGKLFLIVGELDNNVPPESTYRVVDALIKAGKDFDLLVVPGAGHGAGSQITGRRTLDYFVHNLLHDEPPDHNGGTTDAAN